MNNSKYYLVLASIGLALTGCGGGGDSLVPAPAVSESQPQNTSEYDLQTKAAQDAFEKRLAEAQAASDEWLNDNGRNADVITTHTGLQYRVNKASRNPDGIKYQDGQTVQVHYEGRLTDGTVFDSSFDRGRAELLKPAELIEGWQEAINLMQPGDEWTLYIPPSLGYGDLGKGGAIPPNAVLIFDVELR